MYFNEGTARAIEMWQVTDDYALREVLYATEILPAFDKLVENLIFIHGFTGLHDSYDDLKNDCITFLYEALHKFDTTRGSKPFSYFNIVAKHWLIIKSKQRVKHFKKNVSLDDTDTLSQHELQSIEDYHTLAAQDEAMINDEFVQGIRKMLYEIRSRVTNENEIAGIEAVITFFDNINEHDFLLKKRAIFAYLRQISDLSSKQLTTVISSLKKHYRELKDTEEFGLY